MIDLPLRFRHSVCEAEGGRAERICSHGTRPGRVISMKHRWVALAPQNRPLESGFAAPALESVGKRINTMNID